VNAEKNLEDVDVFRIDIILILEDHTRSLQENHDQDLHENLNHQRGSQNHPEVLDPQEKSQDLLPHRRDRHLQQMEIKNQYLLAKANHLLLNVPNPVLVPHKDLELCERVSVLLS